MSDSHGELPLTTPSRYDCSTVSSYQTDVKSQHYPNTLSTGCFRDTDKTYIGLKPAWNRGIKTDPR